MSDVNNCWSNAVEDYTDGNGVISGVPTSRVGERENECPLCRRRIPSEALDDDHRHAAGCNWRRLIQAQRNFAFYGVADPFMVQNGKGKIGLTVTYELDVDFVSDLALVKALESDFTDPNRAVPLSVSGGTVSWRRHGATVDIIKWFERTDPEPKASAA